MSLTLFFCSSLSQVNRYFEGDEELRKRKLEVLLQVGMDRNARTLLGRFLFWWFSFLLRLSRSCVSQTVSTGDTTSIPALRLAECGETYHFGGSLQTDPSLPTNYVASTIHMESQQNMSFTTRMLLSYVELGGLVRNISDFTYVMAGEAPDELPERALGTVRMVHCALNTLPMSCISLVSDVGTVELQAIKPPNMADRDPRSLYLKMFVTDPLVVSAKLLIQSLQGLRKVRSTLNQANPVITMRRKSPNKRESLRAAIDTTAADPFEKAVNELVNILEDVKVPVRRCRDFDSEEYFSSSQNAASTSTASVVSGISAVAMQSGAFIEQSILHTVSRETMRRYFIASDCSLRTASVRLIESATWRAVTFQQILFLYQLIEKRLGLITSEMILTRKLLMTQAQK